MEEIQTTTIEASTNLSIQQGWDILDSVTKYCIWMQPTEEYNLGVRDILNELRSAYITEHPINSFELHVGHNRNTKWHQMYEASKLNGTWRPL